MTRKDIDSLFELLAIFRPNDPRIRDGKLRAAWQLVLGPYERDAVREAVGAWFRKSGFWPDPSDIAQLCPPLPQEPPEPAQPCPAQRALCARWREVVERRRQAGLPATVAEALGQGGSERDWFKRLEEAGLLLEL